jgi:hypothetical protein
MVSLGRSSTLLCVLIPLLCLATPLLGLGFAKCEGYLSDREDLMCGS